MTQTSTETLVIGAGQAGLAASRLLSEAGREHLVLEKNERVASSWRGRWDDFTLVTPNWQLQLPGHEYSGDDPDGFLSRDEVVRYLEDYADSFDPPIRFGTEVAAVRREAHDGPWMVQTTDTTYRARNVVVACGTFQRPQLPAASNDVPAGVHQLHTRDYENPDALPDGGVLVVGSGQSGTQIARELHRAGRPVHLSTSKVGRLPRRYRGRDGMWWAVQLGLTEQTVDQLESAAERFDANPQISGQDGGRDINLHQFARDGISLLGHFEGFRSGRAHLADDLAANLAAGDEMAETFRAGVDKLVAATGLDVPDETVVDPSDGYEVEPADELDLSEAGIQTILWATGFGWDFSWVEAPIFDEFGYPEQQRGVTNVPGLYFLGLHFLHARKSGLFLGVGEDAAHVVEHLCDRR